VIGSSQRPLPDNIALKRDIYPCLGGIRKHNLSRQAVADPRLRPRDHWDRLKRTLLSLCFQIRVKIKVKFCLSKPWKHTRRAEIQLHLFVTSVLDEDGWLASRPGRFAPIERAPGPFELEAGYASVGYW